MVAADPDSREIPGYATSSPFRAEPAHATSVEVTVHLRPATAGRGVGTPLYGALFEALPGEDPHRAYAGVARPDEASVRLYERLGFRHVGAYREAGRKFGRHRDVARYEKRL